MSRAVRIRTSHFARNLLSFIVPSFVPILLLSVLTAFIAGSFVRSEDEKNNYNTLISVQETMDSTFSIATRFAIDYGANNNITIDLKNVLQSDRLDYMLYLKLRNITEYMRSQMGANPHIASMYLYIDNPARRFINDQGAIHVVDDYYDRDWFDFAERNGTMYDGAYQIRRAPVGFGSTNSVEYLTLYHAFTVPGGKKTGIVVVNLNTKNVISALNRLNMDESEGLFIADQQGSVIFQSDRCLSLFNSTEPPSSFHEGMERGTPFLIERVPSSTFGFEYGIVKLKSVAYKLLRQMLLLEGVILCGSLIVGFLLALRNAHRLQRSLRRILKAIETAPVQPLPQPGHEPHNDYDYIEENILEMLSQQDYLKVQLSEKKYRLQVMELLALQSQIHPHFLNNTLQTIYLKAIGLTGGQNDVALMLEHLMIIIRHSLSDPMDRVPLSEEIHVARAYLALEQKQFGNRLQIKWEQDPQDFAVWVPRLVIQPLVENCIRHGMKPRCALTIDIHIQMQDGQLLIAVSDDGEGMSEQRFAQISSILNEPPEMGVPVTENIGLINTAKRLKLTYPNRHVITLQSTHHAGTTVTLFIPVTSEQNQEGGPLQ